MQPEVTNDRPAIDPTRAGSLQIEPLRLKRDQAAEATKVRVLNAAKVLFMRDGIDRVTIAQVAAKATGGYASKTPLTKIKPIRRHIRNK